MGATAGVLLLDQYTDDSLQMKFAELVEQWDANSTAVWRSGQAQLNCSVSGGRRQIAAIREGNAVRG